MAKSGRWIKQLRTIELFSECSTRQLRHIDSLAFPIKANQGAVIAREGSADLQMFVIADGIAMVSRDSQNVDRLHPGDFFPKAALDRTPSSETVTAKTDMELLVFSLPGFRAVLGIPAVRKRLQPHRVGLGHVDEIPATPEGPESFEAQYQIWKRELLRPRGLDGSRRLLDGASMPAAVTGSPPWRRLTWRPGSTATRRHDGSRNTRPYADDRGWRCGG